MLVVGSTYLVWRYASLPLYKVICLKEPFREDRNEDRVVPFSLFECCNRSVELDDVESFGKAHRTQKYNNANSVVS